MQLEAHSIEFAWKAYLLHQGFSLDDLRKKSHNLERGWQAAIDNGISETFMHPLN